jgi:hypothetical protein
MLDVTGLARVARLTAVCRIGNCKSGRHVSHLPHVATWNKRERLSPRGWCYYSSSTPIRMARIRPSTAKIVTPIGKQQNQLLPTIEAASNIENANDRRESGLLDVATTEQQNGMKAIDDEWDEFIRNMDPDSFKPFPISSSVVNKAEPWKSILEYPARAAWRVASTVPPTSFQYAHQQIIQNSIALTKKQTSRKYLRNVFEKTILQQQHLLQLKRDRERQRIVQNTSINEIDAQREAGILPISYGPHETMAMYYFRSYTYFSITRRILLELQSLLSSCATYPLSVRRVYDFGVGTGSATARRYMYFLPIK